MGYAKPKASEEEQSEFNSAIATLKRIDVIKQGLIMATTTEDFDMKWKFLKALFFELVSVMDNKDDEEQRTRFFEVRKKYNEYQAALRTNQKSIPCSVVDAFDDWEIELKNTEQKYGMNMPKKSDPRYA